MKNLFNYVLLSMSLVICTSLSVRAMSLTDKIMYDMSKAISVTTATSHFFVSWWNAQKGSNNLGPDQSDLHPKVAAIIEEERLMCGINEKLTLHIMDDKKFKDKAFSIGTTVCNDISISQKYLEDIYNALEKPEDDYSQGLLLDFRSALKHEIGHIVNKDNSEKKARMALICALGTVAASEVGIYMFSAKNSPLLSLLLAYPLGLIQKLFATALAMKYIRYMESRADDFCISHTINVRELEATKKFHAWCAEGEKERSINKLFIEFLLERLFKETHPSPIDRAKKFEQAMKLLGQKSKN